MDDDVQTIIRRLPKYDDNTPIDWDSLSPEELKRLKTVGQLKEALSKDLDPNKAIGRWKLFLVARWPCGRRCSQLRWSCSVRFLNLHGPVPVP